MKINVVLPSFLKKPGGGFKIMYEYANRLENLGFDVAIYHCNKLSFTVRENTPNWIIKSKYGFRAFFGNQDRPTWFDLNQTIPCKKIPFIANKYIRDADIIISTWWATAFECRKLSITKGRVFNLIQGYENWAGNEDLLIKSYNIPGQVNITISNYLKEKVAKVSNNRLELIPNSINLNEFFIKNPIKERISTTISLMYSKQELKGSKYALDALSILKTKYPNLTVQVFSVYSRPRDLADWISFYKNPPDLCTIYNETAIFLSPSLEEGWGLTPMESLASGCACIATNIPGHREFLVDGKNSLLVSSKNVNEIVDKVSFLIDNNDFRINLAEAGVRSLSPYTWDSAILKFQTLLKE